MSRSAAGVNVTVRMLASQATSQVAEPHPQRHETPLDAGHNSRMILAVSDRVIYLNDVFCGCTLNGSPPKPGARPGCCFRSLTHVD